MSTTKGTTSDGRGGGGPAIDPEANNNRTVVIILSDDVLSSHGYPLSYTDLYTYRGADGMENTIRR